MTRCGQQTRMKRAEFTYLGHDAARTSWHCCVDGCLPFSVFFCFSGHPCTVVLTFSPPSETTPFPSQSAKIPCLIILGAQQPLPGKAIKDSLDFSLGPKRKKAKCSNCQISEWNQGKLQYVQTRHFVLV